MNGFVAARRPARALLQASRVIGTPNKDGSALNLLEMAFQAQIGVAHGQQLGVDTAMDRVTCRAAFPHGFVLEHKRAALGRMTFQAGFAQGG